jgi:SAM-dependent methyltransferase
MGDHDPTRGFGLLEVFLAKKRAKKADSLIPQELRSGKILDVGCGSTPYFLLSTEFRDKYGLDPSIRNLQAHGDIDIKDFDVESNDRFPFEDSFFDVVTMLAVFEHIQSDKLVRILREVRRVLKVGGRFIMTTPSPWSDGILKVMAILRLISPTELDEHEGTYYHGSIASYLEDGGFKRDRMRFGYFEMSVNTWAYVDK